MIDKHVYDDDTTIRLYKYSTTSISLIKEFHTDSALDIYLNLLGLRLSEFKGMIHDIGDNISFYRYMKDID